LTQRDGNQRDVLRHRQIVELLRTLIRKDMRDVIGVRQRPWPSTATNTLA
jgi:hypothetical protein